MLQVIVLAATIIAAWKLESQFRPGVSGSAYAILASWLASFVVWLVLGVLVAFASGPDAATYGIIGSAGAIGAASVIWIAPAVLFFRWRNSKKPVAFKGARWP